MAEASTFLASVKRLAATVRLRAGMTLCEDVAAILIAGKGGPAIGPVAVAAGADRTTVKSGLIPELTLGDGHDAPRSGGAGIGLDGLRATDGLLALPAPAAINNPTPEVFARVVPSNIEPAYLGLSNDVFVTDANFLKGLDSNQISTLLTIPPSDYGFKIIVFPSSSVSNIASPINRTDPGFIGGGMTVGGAPEFVIPNIEIPDGAFIFDVDL